MAQALEMMKILSHPLRLSLLCRLIEEGEMSAGELVEAESDKASQSQISQYLGQLRDRGVVTARKDGHFVYYQISDPRTKALIAALHDLYCPEG